MNAMNNKFKKFYFEMNIWKGKIREKNLHKSNVLELSRTEPSSILFMNLKYFELFPNDFGILMNVHQI